MSVQPFKVHRATIKWIIFRHNVQLCYSKCNLQAVLRCSLFETVSLPTLVSCCGISSQVIQSAPLPANKRPAMIYGLLGPSVEPPAAADWSYQREAEPHWDTQLKPYWWCWVGGGRGVGIGVVVSTCSSTLVSVSVLLLHVQLNTVI